MSESKALVPVKNRVVQWSVVGGVTGINIASLIHVLSLPWYNSGEIFLVGLISMGVGSVFGGAVSLALQLLSSRSLNRIERDLERASAMLERGLIDREDYNNLKSEILAKRIKPRFDWRIPVWSGVLLMTAVLVGISSGVGMLGLIPGALLTGSSAVGLTLVNIFRPEPEALPQGPQWEQLGSRGE